MSYVRYIIDSLQKPETLTLEQLRDGAVRASEFMKRAKLEYEYLKQQEQLRRLALTSEGATPSVLPPKKLPAQSCDVGNETAPRENFPSPPSLAEDHAPGLDSNDHAGQRQSQNDQGVQSSVASNEEAQLSATPPMSKTSSPPLSSPPLSEPTFSGSPTAKQPPTLAPQPAKVSPSDELRIDMTSKSFAPAEPKRTPKPRRLFEAHNSTSGPTARRDHSDSTVDTPPLIEPSPRPQSTPPKSKLSAPGPVIETLVSNVLSDLASIVTDSSLKGPSEPAQKKPKLTDSPPKPRSEPGPQMPIATDSPLEPPSQPPPRAQSRPLKRHTGVPYLAFPNLPGYVPSDEPLFEPAPKRHKLTLSMPKPRNKPSISPSHTPKPQHEPTISTPPQQKSSASLPKPPTHAPKSIRGTVSKPENDNGMPRTHSTRRKSPNEKDPVRSERMRQAWARRQAKGTNGRHGKAPVDSVAIKRAELRAAEKSVRDGVEKVKMEKASRMRRDEKRAEEQLRRLKEGEERKHMEWVRAR